QQNGSASHFDGNSWWAHVKFLADDSLEGRDTGSEGLRKAQTYAVEQLQKAGLEPAGSNGFYQPVRFNQFEVDEAKSSLALITNGQAKPLSFADDAFIGTRATQASVTLSAALVFVGFGLQISEKNIAELASLGTARRPLPHFPLSVSLNAYAVVLTQSLESSIIVAQLPGSDPALKNEFVVLSAHIDHVGIGAPINWDRIYNGAMGDGS